MAPHCARVGPKRKGPRVFPEASAALVLGFFLGPHSPPAPGSGAVVIPAKGEVTVGTHRAASWPRPGGRVKGLRPVPPGSTPTPPLACAPQKPARATLSLGPLPYSETRRWNRHPHPPRRRRR